MLERPTALILLANSLIYELQCLVNRGKLLLRIVDCPSQPIDLLVFLVLLKFDLGLFLLLKLDFKILFSIK